MGSIALISPCIPVITGVEEGVDGDSPLIGADPPPPHETTKEIVKIKKRYFICFLLKLPTVSGSIFVYKFSLLAEPQ